VRDLGVRAVDYAVAGWTEAVGEVTVAFDGVGEMAAARWRSASAADSSCSGYRASPRRCRPGTCSGAGSRSRPRWAAPATSARWNARWPRAAAAVADHGVPLARRRRSRGDRVPRRWEVVLVANRG
jgi:hypothetical protein